MPKAKLSGPRTVDVSVLRVGTGNSEPNRDLDDRDKYAAEASALSDDLARFERRLVEMPGKFVFQIPDTVPEWTSNHELFVKLDRDHSSWALFAGTVGESSSEFGRVVEWVRVTEAPITLKARIAEVLPNFAQAFMSARLERIRTVRQARLALLRADELLDNLGEEM